MNKEERETLKPNMYVRTKDGIAKYLGLFSMYKNINEYKEIGD